jgi:ABC-type multidrug transport system fused ATPase/permease subunit
MGSRADYYSQKVQQLTIALKRTNRSLWFYGSLRLLSFLGAFTLFFVLLSIQVVLASACLIVLMVLFFVFVRIYQNISNKKGFLSELLLLNENELWALDHDFGKFHDGKEFLDPDHFNSYDLDLFGKGSLFQYLNRTATPAGKKLLAKWLQQPLLKTEQIECRQGFVAELASMVAWRQEFTANAHVAYKDSNSPIGGEWQFRLKEQMKLLGIQPVLMFVLVAVSLFTLAVWIINGNSTWFLLASLLQLILWAVNRKAIREAAILMGKQLGALSRLEAMFLSVEQYGWKSREAKIKIDCLIRNGAPSKQINRLRKMVSAFDSRYNMMVGLVLNIVFCWDVWCTWRFHRWHRLNDPFMNEWFGLLAFFDAANSLANFAFNHPEYIYPEVKDGDCVLFAENIGHPLINPRKRVVNDFVIQKPETLSLITGANMSGKSTFLRTIGVNMVLAMTGSPVCAGRMIIPPIEVFSNMRNTDSLFDDESYFFAELKRLKQMLDELASGRRLLILLDEILKGTNSIDKLNGSMKLLERLIAGEYPVVLATHDLKLTELENQYPRSVSNYCFEIEIVKDEMKFDYRLRRGVTQVMNASFLMKKMGITS